MDGITQWIVEWDGARWCLDLPESLLLAGNRWYFDLGGCRHFSFSPCLLGPSKPASILISSLISIPSATGSSDLDLHWWCSKQSGALTANIKNWSSYCCHLLCFCVLFNLLSFWQWLTCFCMLTELLRASVLLSITNLLASFCFLRLLFSSVLDDGWQTQQEQWKVFCRSGAVIKTYKEGVPHALTKIPFPVYPFPFPPPIILVGEMWSLYVWIIDFNDHFIVGSVTEEIHCYDCLLLGGLLYP